MTVGRLKKRPDFLRAAGGRKAHSALFTIQAVEAGVPERSGCRVGFTVTKKVGDATERNRIKRRLREAVRVTPSLSLAPGHDYVIVARRDVLTAPFATLQSGLKGVFRKLQSGRRAPDGSGNARFS